MALSDKERDILASLEQELASDPKFVNSMTSSHRFQMGSTRNIILGTVGVITGIAILLAGIATQLIILGVIGFGVMVAGALLAFHGGKDNSRIPHSSGVSSKAKSPFMKNLEDKWEQRRNEQL